MKGYAHSDLEGLCCSPHGFPAGRALSGLGRASPKCAVSGYEVLVAVKAYFDSSGKIASSKILALAGIAASDEVWADFEIQWAQTLAQRTPPAPYLHMKELVSASGPYTDALGWDDQKRQSLLHDCFFIAYNLPKDSLRAFSATLDMQCLRALRLGKHNVMPSAIELLNYYVPSKVFDWFCHNIHSQQPREAYFFFDQGEPFKGVFENQVIRRKKSSRMTNAWHMVKMVANADMRDTPQLQLADMFAWSNYRKHSADALSKWHSMSVFTDAVFPYTRVDLDRDALLMIFRRMRVSPEFRKVWL